MSSTDLIHLLSGSRSLRATQGLAGQERLSGVWPVRDDLDAFSFPIYTFCVSTVSSPGKTGLTAHKRSKT